MNVITIGRGSNNDVIIQDTQVSRNHLQIVRHDDGCCTVVDLNSANGTFVNEQRISGIVNLQPNDTIKIGNTTLPWQEYINAISSKGIIPSINESSATSPSPRRRNNILIYIWSAIVFLVLIIGIGFYIYHNSANSEDKGLNETERINQEENVHKNLDEKEKEANRLQKEADELFCQALLISENNRNKDLAESKEREAKAKQKEVDIAKAKVAEAQKDVQKAKAEVEAAQKSAKKAEEEKKQAELEKDNATAAINAANNAKAAAEQASKDAKESEILTTQFYDLYIEINDKTAKKVCTNIGKKVPNGVTAKTHLKEIFNSSNKNDKRTIISQIKIATPQKKSETTQNSEKTKQTAEPENSQKASATEEDDE